MPVETVNDLVALGTLGLEVVTAVLFIAYLLRGRIEGLGALAAFVGTWGVWIALLAASAASVLSLVYSELLGFPPCPLCWWQRVFMYGQVVLFAVALAIRDRAVALYGIVFSVIGLGIALYHHVLQMLPSGTLPCPAQGEVSCGQRLLFEFGHITFPWLAVVCFSFLLVLMLFVRAKDRAAA